MQSAHREILRQEDSNQVGIKIAPSNQRHPTPLSILHYTENKKTRACVFFSDIIETLKEYEPASKWETLLKLFLFNSTYVLHRVQGKRKEIVENIERMFQTILPVAIIPTFIRVGTLPLIISAVTLGFWGELLSRPNGGKHYQSASNKLIKYTVRICLRQQRMQVRKNKQKRSLARWKTKGQEKHVAHLRSKQRQRQTETIRQKIDQKRRMSTWPERVEYFSNIFPKFQIPLLLLTFKSSNLL